MPTHVRNFWLELSVDGRKSRIETGPVRKDGGFELTVKMRQKGGIINAAVLRGYVENAGDTLTLEYTIESTNLAFKEGEELTRVETTR